MESYDVLSFLGHIFTSPCTRNFDITLDLQFHAISNFPTAAGSKYMGQETNHGITHYQTTNFRLFQTERVCRRQFDNLTKMAESYPTR